MLRRSLRCALLVFCSLPSLRLAAQSQAALPADKLKKVEAIISSEMSRENIPGLSAAIVNNNQLVWSSGYGLADLENFVPAKAATVYRLASVSKPITATAVMQLVERGKVELEAPAQKYCPAFPQKSWAITVHQLLDHQSGIRHYKNDEESVSTRHYNSLAESFEIFKNDPLLFEPGTKISYTTYGYSVLGCIVEGATGMKYADYMRENIFKPAGMTNTRADDVYEIVENRAKGYSKSEGGRLRNSVLLDLSYKIPGGGLTSTVEDLARFALALQNETLIKRETLRQMWTPQKTRDGEETIYGLGWYIFERNGQKEVGHGGDQQGVSAVLYLVPDKHLVVALMANLDNVDTLSLVRQVADAAQ